MQKPCYLWGTRSDEGTWVGGVFVIYDCKIRAHMLTKQAKSFEIYVKYNVNDLEI